MICRNATQKIPEGSKFCTNCGAPLEQPQQAAPEQPIPAADPEQPAQRPQQGTQGYPAGGVALLLQPSARS